ncbi:major facilitator superfamily domain-containing protein [Mycena pura]|uniref:Major facilitator superfamily domain-containing protein n=1 Tax=Mycena pura TaxID=153505 RepID=A0AAD6VQR9_9AGAR|nr:major facilitator superfamily domain-containing protein [Mycena pura]
MSASNMEIAKKVSSDEDVILDKERAVEGFDSVAHAKILRKLDVHLLPFVSLLYLLSFLDRANVGNAKVAGMAKDADLIGFRYNIIAAVFFVGCVPFFLPFAHYRQIPYALAEVPSYVFCTGQLFTCSLANRNIILKLVRPSRWIPSIMLAWGLVMTLMCLCKTYHELIIARVFLGLTEAGLFPGITFYLSLWYRRRDVASRVAIFFSAATVAGAFGGILAFAIEKMEGIGGLHGWQWIFCLEGLAAGASYFYMHDYPETATFLSEEERKQIVHLLKEDSQDLATHYDRKFVWQAIADYQTYVQIGIYIGLLIPVYAIALFTPTIVQELGFTAAQAQLLTIPPFVCGCFATIAVGLLSDKYNLRGPFVIGSSLVGLVGYIILYTQKSPGAGYAGAVLAAVGVYPTIAVDLAWAGSIAGGDVRKGVVIAMVIGLGNLGGICSSFIYFQPPYFHVGHGTIMGFLSLTIILSCFAMWDYNRINKQRDAYCAREGIDAARRAEFRDMGSESPLFRYTI